MLKLSSSESFRLIEVQEEFSIINSIIDKFESPSLKMFFAKSVCNFNKFQE
jgi:hypothetical protein